MTVDKLEKVFEYYRDYLQIHTNTSQYVVSANPLESYRPKHLMYMIVTVLDDLIPQGKIEKAMRWLGWVQCAMVVNGYFTLEEVKSHSRPEVRDNPMEPFQGVIFQLKDESWIKLEVKDDVTPKDSVHIAVLLTVKTVNIAIDVGDFLERFNLTRHFVPTDNPW